MKQLLIILAITIGFSMNAQTVSYENINLSGYLGNSSGIGGLKIDNSGFGNVIIQEDLILETGYIRNSSGIGGLNINSSSRDVYISKDLNINGDVIISSDARLKPILYL